MGAKVAGLVLWVAAAVLCPVATASAQEPPPVVEEPPPAAEASPAVAEESAPVVEEPPPAAEEPAAVAEEPPAVAVEVAAVSETSSAAASRPATGAPPAAEVPDVAERTDGLSFGVGITIWQTWKTMCALNPAGGDSDCNDKWVGGWTEGTYFVLPMRWEHRFDEGPRAALGLAVVALGPDYWGIETMGGSRLYAVPDWLYLEMGALLGWPLSLGVYAALGARVMR